jgi:hypothetical protein
MHKKGVLYGDKSIVIDNLSTSEERPGDHNLLQGVLDT